MGYLCDAQKLNSSMAEELAERDRQLAALKAEHSALTALHEEQGLLSKQVRLIFWPVSSRPHSEKRWPIVCAELSSRGAVIAKERGD